MVNITIMKNQEKRKVFLSNDARMLLKEISKGDMIMRNHGRSMIWFFKRGVEPLIGSWNNNLIFGLKSFAHDCHCILRANGIKFLVLYLKASQVLLQQSVGGYKIPDTRPLKCAVSRTKSGIPTIIPSSHRKFIRMGSRLYIRYWMTLLGLFRILEFPGSLNFSSITDPGSTISGDFIMEFRNFILNHFWKELVFTRTKLVQQAISRNARDRIDLITPFMKLLVAKPFVIRKSSPTVPKSESDRDVIWNSTSPDALRRAAFMWMNGSGTIKVYGHETLFQIFSHWLTATNNKWLVNLIKTLMEAQCKLPVENNLKRFSLGKLGTKDEPAGKVRVFAMVDAFTQWALRPLHDQLFSVLKRIPQDGTMDQHKPLKALLKKKGIKGLWSYDLTAATDRLPILLQHCILMPVLGLHGADWWQTLLVKRDYHFKGVNYKYSVGQPMGALSSWAMLAITHHAIVQFAYYRVCVRNRITYRWYQDYAILGDDVVVSSEVYNEYLIIMKEIGVGIGLAKSLVSPTKVVAEFAKKFYIPADASMIPFKESVSAWFNSSEMIQFSNTYKLSVNQVLRAMGFGFKSLNPQGRKFSSCSKRLRNTLLLLLLPSSHLGIPWEQFFSLQGWKMLRCVNSRRLLQSMKEHIFNSLESRMKELGRYASQAHNLMLVKRSLKLGLPIEWDEEIYGNRIVTGPIEDWLGLLDLMQSELQNKQYKYSVIKQELADLKKVILEWESFRKILNLQQEISALGMSTNFLTRVSGSLTRPSIRLSEIKFIVMFWKVIKSAATQKSSKPGRRIWDTTRVTSSAIGK